MSRSKWYDSAELKVMLAERNRSPEMRALVVERNFKHGMYGTRTYVSWQKMMQRTRNPRNNRFALYGGRGIRVCERWHDFRNFVADMGERPEGRTLDRIDVDGDYEPSNCRWATAQEQRANRRVSA